MRDARAELQAAAEMADDTDPAGAIARHLLRHCSLVANNLGVLLEDDGLTHEAFTTYLQSRTIFPENVSAALNMARMIDAGYESDLAQDIRAHLEALKEQASSHQNMLALSVSYGYVREPETFSGIARTWALTGQPRMAALSLEKALDVLDPKQYGTIKADLAGLYLDQSRDEESAALFYEALAEDPTERRAIMGLARIAARKGQFDEAEAFLVQAASAGVPADALSMERAVIAVLRSDFAQAREISERLVREDESRILAWRLLADLLARSQNWAELKRVSDRLSMSELGRPLAAEIRALLSLRNADVASARRFYAEVLAAQPANVNVRSQAMRLELVSADLKAAQSLARPILEIDGDHGLANYVIGAARLASGEYELAEEALRRCVARERLPQALNDLSWLLLQRKAYAEAESLAREATDLQPTMYQAWDTLGEILLRQGKLTEAEVFVTHIYQ